MADHLAAPTPLEEHRKLAVFAGKSGAARELFFPRAGSREGLPLRTSRLIDLNGFYLIWQTPADARRQRRLRHPRRSSPRPRGPALQIVLVLICSKHYFRRRRFCRAAG